MWLVSYIVLDVIPFDRLIDERRIWLGASVWMAYKLIGGVPSFVVDFRHGLYIDYGNKYEDFKKHDSP